MHRFGVALLALALAGCGGDDGDAPGPSAVVLYGPAAESELNLFPSNRYTEPDTTSATGLRVHIGTDNTTDQLATAYPITLTELNQLDGFSTVGGIAVRFSHAIDANGLVELPDHDPPVLDPVRDASEYTQAGSPLLLVNVDPSSAEHGKALGIVPRYYEQLKDVDYPVDDFTLIAEPAVPMLPGTRYAFIVTKELHASDGKSVARDAEMNRALTSSKDAYDVELRAAVDDAVASVGITKKDVVAATLFTTESSTADVVALSKARRAAPAPALVDPWTIETPAKPTDPRVRFRATFPSPEYRKAKPDGKWELDAQGVPKSQGDVDLEVFLAFSDSTKSGPRPVVIYQHGLGGDKDGCWGTTERLAALASEGVAVFAIDSPEHGARGSGTDSVVSSAFGFFGVDESSLEFDIGRARDNFRQMAFDQLELVRLIDSLGSLDLLPLDANGKPAPDGKPDLDVSRILYIGHSFGSVQGATIFALAPEITQATWNVGGSGLMMLLRDSNLFSFAVIKTLTPPGTPFGSVARFMAATQGIVDPGDPLNYARYGTLEALPGVADWKPRDVLIQEVVDDTIVPNSTSEALARAAGMGILHRVKGGSGLEDVSPPVEGNAAQGSTAVVAQFDKMQGDKIATHGELIFSPEAQAQYVKFFQTGLASSHASVPAPY